MGTPRAGQKGFIKITKTNGRTDWVPETADPRAKLSASELRETLGNILDEPKKEFTAEDYTDDQNDLF